MPVDRLPALTRPLLACLVAVLLTVCGNAAAQQPPTPMVAQDFIRMLSDEALKILADPGQPLEKREQHVRDLMDEHVAIDFLARFALGKHWPRASEDERKEYTVLFRRFFLLKYAGMLGGYDDQVVTISNAKPAGDSDVLVETSIKDGGGAPPIKAGWRVRLFDDEPKIIDIVIEGISMALNQRQEFSSVLSRGGLTGLMDVLRATTERVPAQAPA